MALVPFPGPQVGSLPARSSTTTRRPRRARCRFWSISTSSGNASSSRLIGVARRLLVGFAFINQHLRLHHEADAAVLPPGSRLIYTQPGEAFVLYIQISLIAGVVLAAPWIMYQVWLFIAPGLYANEKRLAIPFVALVDARLHRRRGVQSLRRRFRS